MWYAGGMNTDRWLSWAALGGQVVGVALMVWGFWWLWRPVGVVVAGAFTFGYGLLVGNWEWDRRE